MSGRRSKRLRAEQTAPPRLPDGVRRTVETPIAGRRILVAGSDAKQTTYGTCILCGTYAQLELGHVVPRWAGKWLKDEGYVLGKYDSLGVHTRSQDIEKHYMMCRTCENFLGAAEGYLANIVRGTREELAARSIALHRETDELVRLDSVDSTLALRALLGVLFKAHMSPHHIFRHIRLPAWALSEVLAALKQDVYLRSRFSVIALKIVNLTVPDVNPRARIEAELRTFGPGVGAALRFGGFSFFVHVGAVDRFELEDKMPSLRPGETEWRIGIGEFVYEPGILPEDAFDVPRVPGRYLSATDRCPCGLDRDFSQCCQGRWLPARTRFLDFPNQATRQLRPHLGL
jgi:hypothetical protein